MTDDDVRIDNSGEGVDHEQASEMFYPDGRRAQTRADKVLDDQPAQSGSSLQLSDHHTPGE